MRAYITFVHLVVATATNPASEACLDGQCPGVSMVQLEKDMLNKEQSSRDSAAQTDKCQEEGQRCESYQSGNGFVCYRPFGSSRTKVAEEYTKEGECEKLENIMLRCIWTQKGTEYAADNTACLRGKGTNLDANRCPRVRDPVEKAEYMAGYLSGNWNQDLISMWEMDWAQCHYFNLKCQWTTAGAKEMAAAINTMFAVPPPITCNGLDGAQYGCPVAGQKVTYDQASLLSQNGLLPPQKRSWVSPEFNRLMTCTTQQQAYAAWAQRPVRAKNIQCGNLPYNCDTKEQAEQACRDWSKDSSLPGSGAGHLCYKHELGETVGRNCRWAWTKDAEGKQGCYESGGVPGNRPSRQSSSGLLLPDTCTEPVGTVMCYTMDDVAPKAAADEVQFSTEVDHQIGFDAACCEGHLADPYYLFPNTR